MVPAAAAAAAAGGRIGRLLVQALEEFKRGEDVVADFPDELVAVSTTELDAFVADAGEVCDEKLVADFLGEDVEEAGLEGGFVIAEVVDNGQTDAAHAGLVVPFWGEEVGEGGVEVCGDDDGGEGGEGVGGEIDEAVADGVAFGDGARGEVGGGDEGLEIALEAGQVA